MCGRFLLRKVDEVLAEMFAVAGLCNALGIGGIKLAKTAP
jgi:hypothetical protein